MKLLHIVLSLFLGVNAIKAGMYTQEGQKADGEDEGLKAEGDDEGLKADGEEEGDWQRRGTQAQRPRTTGENRVQVHILHAGICGLT